MQICSDEKIECGFARVNGYLFPHATTPEAFQKLDLELLAAKDAKVPGVERVNLGEALFGIHGLARGDLLDASYWPEQDGK